MNYAISWTMAAAAVGAAENDVLQAPGTAMCTRIFADMRQRDAAKHRSAVSDRRHRSKLFP